MKILRWFVLVINLQEILLMDTFQNLVDDFKIHHITIFRDYKLEKDFKLDSFYPKIVNNNPTVIVDLIKIRETNRSNRTSVIPIFQNPRQITIYIILQSTNNSININDTLHFLVEKSPISMRPKCLVVLSQTGSLTEDVAKKILHDAWSLKFLDFSVLRINSYEKPVIYMNYNPFTKKFNHGYFKNKNDLFPDKLNNVNKYPFLIPAFNFPPYMIFQTLNSNVISFRGNAPFVYLIAIVEKLNFALSFKFHQGETLGKEYYRAAASVAKGETDVTPIRYHFSDHMLHLDVLLGKVLEVSEWVMITPILLEYTVDIPLETFIYVVSFVFIVATFSSSLRVLKLKSKQWSLLNLFGVLIGMGISQPTKNAERIIFITLAVLSIVYTGDFFSTLADIKVSGTEREFNTYEDINKLKIPVYTTGPKEIYDIEFQEKILFHKIMFDYKDCLNKSIYTRNAICVMDLRTAVYVISNNLNTEGKRILKIPVISIDKDFVGFLHKKASPFAEKFNRLIQQMIEFSVFPDRKVYKTELHSVTDESLVNDETIIKTALSILFTGSIIASIAFIYELYNFIKTLKKYKKHIRKIKKAFKNFKY